MMGPEQCIDEIVRAASVFVDKNGNFIECLPEKPRPVAHLQKKDFDILLPNEAHENAAGELKKRDETVAEKIEKKSRKKKITLRTNMLDEISVKRINMPEQEKASERHYRRQLEQYRQFMAEYLKETPGQVNSRCQYDAETEKPAERQFKHGDELISYRQRVETAKAMHMNALMRCPVNHVEPEMKDLYEFWKMSSKFNQLMSFFYYDSVFRM